MSHWFNTDLFNMTKSENVSINYSFIIFLFHLPTTFCPLPAAPYLLPLTFNPIPIPLTVNLTLVPIYCVCHSQVYKCLRMYNLLVI